MRVRATEKPIWLGRDALRCPPLRFLAVHRVVHHNPIPLHRLPCWEIGIADRGSLRLELDGRIVSVAAGQLVVVPSRCPIRTPEERSAPVAANAGGLLWWIGLDESPVRMAADGGLAEALEALYRRMLERSIDAMPAGPLLLDAVRSLYSAAASGEAGVLALRSAGLGVLAHLWAALDRAAPVPSAGPSLVDPAIRHIAANLHRPPRVRDLARLCRMSLTTFNTEFRRSQRATPAEFVLRMRIERACDWLSRTDWPISRIAARLGFSSPQYFAVAFRRVTGQTPSCLRQGGVDRR